MGGGGDSRDRIVGDGRYGCDIGSGWAGGGGGAAPVMWSAVAMTGTALSMAAALVLRAAAERAPALAA